MRILTAIAMCLMASTAAAAAMQNMHEPLDQATQGAQGSVGKGVPGGGPGTQGASGAPGKTGSISAAPIGTAGELARIKPAITKVVQRHHYVSQVRNNGPARKHNSDEPRPNSDSHDLDSNSLPFGSREWWDQHWTGGTKKTK
jgi:hypothetical protein